MKTINAKRIAAVAASLLMGLAFAGTGGVTWSNIPIISNQGQPVVQIVVGSQAAPSDGVVAGNIAAVIGSLEFTSVNVTATPSGLGNVNCVVTTPTCTLTNQQVWFNEKGFSTPSGSYGFTALIGSVLNGAVQAGIPSSTKTLQGVSSYAYPNTQVGSNGNYATTLSPSASPFSGAPNVNYPVSPNNGGGLSFSTFESASQDNVLEITPAQLPALANNWGSYGQSEYLWITGFPVYDQQVGTTNNATTPNLVVASFGGAYQTVFAKPIQEPWNVNGAGKNTFNTINNAAIKFLGANWTILNATTPSALQNAPVSTSNAIAGGKLSLASTLSPIQTVYVGHNVSSGGFTVSLTDLGQPNGQAVSAASVDIYYNGTLTNTTQLTPPSTTKFTVGGKSVFVHVNQTFAGLYAYQKWAKIQLYSNVFNITNGQILNQTNADGWLGYIYWTNTTTSTNAKENALQSIVVVKSSSGLNQPGTALTFVNPNMTNWRVTFVGDTLGSDYDPVTFTTSTQTGMNYQNLGTNPQTPGLGNINNLSQETAQILTVRSQIPDAFTAPGLGTSASTLTYDLTPYQLNEMSNSFHLGVVSSVTPSGSVPTNVVVSSTVVDGNIINPSTPLSVYVQGYTSNTASAPTTASAQITFSSGAYGGAANVVSLGTSFFNITNIYLSQPLPYIQVNVIGIIGSPLGSPSANSNVLATLTTDAKPTAPVSEQQPRLVAVHIRISSNLQPADWNAIP
jgi:hypothetical protein